MDTCFALLAFGRNADIHTQACYALLSAMASVDGECDWFVVTDMPEFYRWFEDSIQLIYCSEEQLTEWRGEHDFFWRVKIRAIQTVAEKTEGHLIYLDSDIICKENLSELIRGLDSGQCYMHKLEYPIGSTRSTTGRRMWRIGGGQTYAGYEMGPDTSMWNAGVIGIPFNQLAKLNDVLACCDAMCESSMPNKLLEQYSFSLVLGSLGRLTSAERWFVHYWGNKSAWLTEIQRVLARILLMKISLQEAIEIVCEHNIELPIYVRKPWAVRTWEKLKRHLIKSR